MSYSDYLKLTKVKQEFKPVSYNDADHRYFSGRTTYISATQLLSLFKPKFDTKERSEYMANRYGMTPQYWVDRWGDIRDTSLVRGNEIHADKEAQLYKKGTIHYFNNITLRVLKRDDFPRTNYINLPIGVYPELLLWNHKNRIAGRADNVIITEKHVEVRHKQSTAWMYSRVADLEDYKTGRIIHTQSYQNPKTGKYQMMTGPLSHFQDCEMNHYAIQLSIYQYMLECMGFVPGKRTIIHIKHEIEFLGTPPPVHHDLPYLKNEVISMLNYLKARRSKCRV
jgi:hypothetical protein